MLYFSILLCLTCLLGGAFLGIVKYGRWHNPMTLLNTLFFLIVFFASFRFFSYKEVQYTTYLIIAFAMLGYNIGCILTPYKKRLNVQRIHQLGHSKKLSKYIILMDVVLIIIYVCELINVSVYYAAGAEPATIRGAYFEGNIDTIVGSMELWSLIRPYIEAPLTITCIVISSLWLILYKKKLQFALSIFFIGANIAISYGRFIVVYVIISLIIAAALSSKYLILKRSAGKVKWLVVVLAVVIFMISSNRGVDKFAGFVYEYFCGCVFLLDQLLAKIPENLTWGVCSFASLISPTYTVLHQFGIPYSSEYMRALGVLALKDDAYVISETGQVTNAFSTPVFALYADFGLIGVILGMCFLGYVVCKIYYLAIQHPSERNICMYSIVAINLFKCIQDYPFTNSLFTFSLAFIWILYRKDYKLCKKK